MSSTASESRLDSAADLAREQELVGVGDATSNGISPKVLAKLLLMPTFIYILIFAKPSLLEGAIRLSGSFMLQSWFKDEFLPIASVILLCLRATFSLYRTIQTVPLVVGFAIIMALLVSVFAYGQKRRRMNGQESTYFVIFMSVAFSAIHNLEAAATGCSSGTGSPICDVTHWCAMLAFVFTSLYSCFQAIGPLNIADGEGGRRTNVAVMLDWLSTTVTFTVLAVILKIVDALSATF